jgi:membrane-associated phospholipid phosphatase
MSKYRGGFSLAEIVKYDVELIWSIQDFIFRRPGLDRLLSRLVSKQPWNDIGLLVWIVALVGCFEIGVKHFWVVVVNLGGAYLLNRIVQAKRPVEYDVRLQPTTDLHPESYGFPSVESHMAVVVVGHVFKSTSYWVVLLFGIPLALIVGFSRIYSRARFPHQILASYLSGVFGLIAGVHYCEVLGGGFHNMPKHTHGVYVGVAVVIFLANLALNMENNDSRLLFISKAEFVRVIRGILYSGQGEASTGGGGGGGGAVPRFGGDESIGDEDAFAGEGDAFLDANGNSGLGARGMEDPQAAARRKVSEEHMRLSRNLTRRERTKANRKDSFYYLHKSLQARAGVQGGGLGVLAADSPRSASGTGRDPRDFA